MSNEDLKAELERLRNENAALKKGAALKAAAEQAAKADRRSLTSYIEKLIEDDLRAKERQRLAPRTVSRSGRVNR